MMPLLTPLPIGRPAGQAPPPQALQPQAVPQAPIAITPIAAPVSGPPPTGDATGSNRGKIIAGVLVVLALVVVGIFVLTRGDDKQAADSATTLATSVGASTVATVSADTTAATGVDVTAVTDVTSTGVATGDVTTTAGTTSPTDLVTTTSELAATTTTALSATTTLPFAVPDGAIDLGHQVYLPVPQGWSQTNQPGDVVVISDGAGSSASFQALARDAGEDIAALTQEYTDTFDKDFGAVGFGPMRFVRQIAGPLPINQYGLFYTTYDPGDVTGIDGAISIFVRSDGLSLVYDSYTTVGLVPLPDTAYQGMLKSMLDAAPLGAAVTLAEHDPFRVKSVSPFVELSGVVGFTATPGFNVVTQGSGHAQVDNGTESVEVITTFTQPDSATVIVNAENYLSNTTAGVTYSAPTEDAPDVYGVIHGTFTWTGTYTAGTPAAGSIDYYFDPASQNAYVLYRTWNATASTNEPFAAEGAFMRRTFYNSLTTIS
ncbi:MAG: hypothetical protein JWL72_2913 [Ilumatobacteraceae bacterium]|nr:hypothetical protein [Ilumatobacteraceae bacterium]